MKQNLSKDILFVLVTNIFNTCIQLLSSFILPQKLGLDCYADIKTYALYLSYVGLFHFGFIDGMYIKYGGKELHTINREDILKNISTLRNFEFVVAIICIVFSIVIKNFILVFFSISIIPLNMASYFKQLYQATGEFKIYGKIMNFTTGCVFFCNMVLLFIFHEDNGIAYILGNLVIYIMVWIALEYFFSIQIGIKIFASISLKELWHNIRTGILLTLGNLSSTILTSMDRWFVKILLGTVAFAQYSFAVSIENFMNVVVTPVAVTLYNFFCKNDAMEKIVKIRNYVMIFSAFIVMSAYPAKFILEIYLTDYIEASTVMFLLFAAQIFYIVIKCIYINLYKAQKRQRIYFIKLSIVVVIGVISNGFLFYICSVKESFAVGTLLTAIVWYFLCLNDFKQFGCDVKVFYPIVQAIVFIICGIKFRAIVGFGVYLCEMIAITVVVFPEEVLFFIEGCKKVFNCKRKFE